MDQGVVAAFKVYYLRKTLDHAIAATEEDTDAVLEGLQRLWLYQDLVWWCQWGV